MRTCPNPNCPSFGINTPIPDTATRCPVCGEILPVTEIPHAEFNYHSHNMRLTQLWLYADFNNDNNESIGKIDVNAIKSARVNILHNDRIANLVVGLSFAVVTIILLIMSFLWVALGVGIVALGLLLSFLHNKAIVFICEFVRGDGRLLTSQTKFKFWLWHKGKVSNIIDPNTGSLSLFCNGEEGLKVFANKIMDTICR